MKRLLVALVTIGLASTVGAYAALPGATDPTLVNVPQLPGGFVMGGSAFYLEASPTNGDLNYGSVNFPVTNSGLNFFSELATVDSSYDWGWAANIGYIFPNTGNDVNLSYFNFHSSHSDHTSTFPNNFIGSDNFNPGQPGNSDLTSFFAVDADASYNINQVDLTAGQYINVGCRLRLHPIVGLRYADVDRTLHTFGIKHAQNSGDDAYTVIANDASDFSGIGPLAGIDGSYYMGMGFGAVAHADAAVLIGNIDDQLDIASNYITIPSTTIAINTIFNVRDDSNRRVVPVTDLKLGLDYSYMFNNAANSDVTFEIGYQASEYFNAVDNTTAFITSAAIAHDATLAVPGASFVEAHKTSNVGLDGPYASLTFHA